MDFQERLNRANGRLKAARIRVRLQAAAVDSQGEELAMIVLPLFPENAEPLDQPL
jgi:hypothetical protein